jgi:hypothetical protein
MHFVRTVIYALSHYKGYDEIMRVPQIAEFTDHSRINFKEHIDEIIL